MKTIKAIYTNNYGIELVETYHNDYRIAHGKTGAKVTTSEAIKDLGLALKLFDMKLNDMEGQ